MKGTILLVDDARNWYETVDFILQEEGYRVVWAENREQAREAMTSGFKIDVAIVNLNLRQDCPVLDGTGYLMLEEMERKWPQLPRIALSAFREPSDGIEIADKVVELYSRYKVRHVAIKGGRDFAGRLAHELNQVIEEVQSKAPFRSSGACAEMFTWLHLSDLHFENAIQRQYQITQVIKALVDDLKRLREEHQGLKPDVVFFTGDLANKAKPEEFARALEDCLSQVLEGCELQPGSLFIVPGNHDVDRAKTTDLDAGVVQRLYDASQIHALLHDPSWKGYYQQLLQRMEGYQAAMGCIKDLSFDTGTLSWGRTLETKGRKTAGVVGLNSAWMSASVKGEDGEVDDQGKLIIGEPLIRSALAQIEQEQPRPNICIALMHHPLSWLQDWDRQGVEQVLKETCQFILHGHVHETNIHFLGAPSPSTMVTSAGTLFKKYERRDIYTCLDAYNIVQLDLSNDRGTIYFRRFDPVHQRYGIDDTTFKDVRDGQYSFQYGEDGFRPDNSLR